MSTKIYRMKLPKLRELLVSALSLVSENGATVGDLEFCLEDLEKAVSGIKIILDECALNEETKQGGVK